MSVERFEIEGPVLIKTRKFADERGCFFESYNTQLLNEILGDQLEFVQDNISVSKKGVIRGLHLQAPPYAQGKLVRVLKGSVIDVAVDIRKSSPTYGKYVRVFLSAENGDQFWIPEGFAHGFSALEEDTIFSYKCTNYYHPASEKGIRFDDPDLNIDWEINEPIVNQKDYSNSFFATFDSPF
ncbi:MAG: dTDP-4-dehydrorhamnose 3,5-epimerase [Flavobacteriia bacterium]|nr:dTDP-4-dehydrorhamnose 3,5-epimerase [Flavobacteriia bacterium]OJX39976.1 MAG: dTDP-4-dehydrorhamnose 3,5-epimerase [Flavobacteriia bacterium 40-80]